jgi:hypothetical protein
MLNPKKKGKYRIDSKILTMLLQVRYTDRRASTEWAHMNQGASKREGRCTCSSSGRGSSKNGDSKARQQQQQQQQR